MMLFDLVRNARRRLIYNDLFSQGANASSAALFALILLLLMGTQILDWQWLVPIPLAAVVYGLFRTWVSRPAPYRVAQTLDRDLGFADTLSTALFFEDSGRRASVPDAIRECQHAQADRLCRQVDLPSAVPFRMPRTAYASAALLMVASSLFALRYGLNHSLDLKPPLARIIHRSLGGSDPVERASAKKDGPRVPDLDQMGMSLSDRENGERLDGATASALDNSSVPDVDNSGVQQAMAEGRSDEGDQISTDEPGEESDEAGAGDNAGEGQKGGAQSKDGKEGGSSQQANNEKNSLMDKFKDAMQNLLSKMKIPPPQGGQQKSSQMAQNKQGKAQSQGGQQSKGQGQKKMDGAQDGAQEGESAESKGEQSTDAKGNGQDGEQRADKQPGSGVGKQDGDKDLKLAEQMAAMGKLSEIIGKRSANVSGEAMVEVKNTNQALSTRYEARRATHGESGSEINRDEVPVALQGYVEKYFEQVRQEKK